MSKYAVMPLTDYVSTCDAVREKVGTTDSIKSSELPDKISEVYDTGYDKGYSKGYQVFDGYVAGGGKTYTINTTYIRYYAFQSMTSLTTIYAPNVTSIGGRAFASCAKLSTIEIPKATYIEQYCFQGCTALTSINLPAIKTITANSFWGCSALKTVIIGTTDCSLSSTNAFSNTPIASGTGYIYVPDEAVETYKTKTNWTTYANQIKGISELST